MKRKDALQISEPTDDRPSMWRLYCPKCKLESWVMKRPEPDRTCRNCPQIAAAREVAKPRRKLLQKAKHGVLSGEFAVHPSQIAEAERAYADAGVPVKFAPDGRAIVTGWGHRRKLRKARGFSGD